MKLVISALLLSLTLPAFAQTWNTDVCKERIPAVEQTLRMVKSAFEVGETTRPSVEYIAAKVFKAKYECGLLTKTDYCQAVEKSTALTLEGRREERAVGQATFEQFADAQEVYFSVRNECR